MTRPLGAAPTTRALPAEWTSFVGRESELADVEQLLTDSRMLTLTGAGGSGKTRLAREVIARGRVEATAAFAWVELAALEDPALVPRQVASAFGIAEEAPSPAGLVDLLRGRIALVVLDNCEHLVDACAELTQLLLEGCPGLRILATSREALGVKGERTWRVPPLAIPPVDGAESEIAGAEAVRLFVDRARDAAPGFVVAPENASAVAEICRRLDGIPLALELAAARIKVLSPLQIRDRLDDAFRVLAAGGRTAIPRHRTLRAAIDWSHDLLPPAPQVLFRRLSVFRGGLTLDAAEWVCAGDAINPEAVLDEVARLVDRSLLGFQEEGGAARYTLLETVRQYAAERLAESGEEERVRARHAAFVVELVRTWEPDFITPRRRIAFHHVMPEMDNIREALSWTRQNDPRTHVQLVGALWWFWYSTRHWVEAGSWIDGALQLEEAARPGIERAALLFAAGALASLRAQGQTAIPLLEEAAALAEASGQGRLRAYALNYLGMAYTQQVRPEGRAPSEQAEAWFRENGDDYGLRLALLLLGLAAAGRGDMDHALRLTEEAVAVARRFGEERELSVALQNLALLHVMKGDLDQAEPLLMESFAASRRDPSYLFVATSLDTLGEARIRRGRILEAARILGAAEAIRDLIGARPFPITRVRLEPLLASLLSGEHAEAFARAWAAGRELGPTAVLDEILAESPYTAPEAPTAPAGSTASAGITTPASPVPGVALPARVEEQADGYTEAADPATGGAVDLRIRALGPLRVELRGRQLDGGVWSYAKPRELLVFLAVHPAGRTRDEIGRAIWAGASAAQVKNSFHVSLHHLRKTLGDGGWVVMDGDRYRLAPDVRFDLDADRFEREARAALEAGSPTVDRLRQARALFGGDFLDGEVVGPWHEEHRDRLRRLWVDLSLRLAALLEADGDDGAAALMYHEVAVREELNEEAQRGLMRTWSRTGHRARALRHYERLLAVLRDELDSEPEPETVAVYDGIRSATPV
jgi:predicted ATPase/DNA-binding SARP family transcriptional activator